MLDTDISLVEHLEEEVTSGYQDEDSDPNIGEDVGPNISEDVGPNISEGIYPNISEDIDLNISEQFHPKDELDESDMGIKEELWDSMDIEDTKMKEKVKYGTNKNHQVINELRKKVRGLRATLFTMKKRAKAKKEKELTENKIRAIVRKFIANNLSKVWASFVVDNKVDRGGCWTEQEVLKAIGLRRISKKAYNYMRDNKLCPLPGRSTMQTWVRDNPEWDIQTIGEYVRPTVTVSKKINNQRKQKDQAAKANPGSDVNPCGRCGKNFEKSAQLHQHLAEVHGDERARKMQCHVCDKWVSNERVMVGHQNMHMGIKPFKCTFCDRSYQTLTNMRTHRKEAHAEEWKVERGKLTSRGRASSKPCPNCGETFPLKSDLNQHLAETHGDSGARALQCQTCDKWLSSKLMLKNHTRTHTGERPFICDFCRMSFFSEKTLSAHRQERHPEEWKANKDKIQAQNKEEGRRKMRASYREGGRKVGKRKTNTSLEHNGEAPILDEETGMLNDNLFKCDFCEKAFITNLYLVVHQKEVHREERNEEILKRRIAAKASDNPCPQCGKNFPIQALLNEHLADIHGDPKAKGLKCTDCRKWFGSKQLLINHMKTHTGNHQCKCDFCPKTFTTNKSMGFHRKEMHHEEWEARKISRKREIEGGENGEGQETVEIDEYVEMIYHQGNK